MNQIESLRNWARLIQKTRAYFQDAGFIEVFTNQLVPSGAFESSLDCLSVQWSKGRGELHTSPEIEMKVLLAEIKEPIFQITHCFRDDPKTDCHWVEFTMLEFYEPFVDYQKVIARTIALIQSLSPKPIPVDYYSMSEIFQDRVGISLIENATTSKLREVVLKKTICHLDPTDEWNDIFYKILIEKIEPSLQLDRLTVIQDYPASQCALGKVSGAITERFEIYGAGMELCNGCTELTDLSELKIRFESESKNRAQRGQKPHLFPQRLATALQNNLPPCAGVAIGLDRIFKMLNPTLPSPNASWEIFSG